MRTVRPPPQVVEQSCHVLHLDHKQSAFVHVQSSSSCKVWLHKSPGFKISRVRTVERLLQMQADHALQ
eukprot:CAMPEP_0197634200 /NCGR_PEP_ID=MMETSP1338-20131121/10364_1 /TAXON_ID=43686 ORGANISM="Pelagodinium beii, Strain RCC1491" /NCGR_SAMPLE_ID=MMETSP1338 /ASSEMBLY_ACC=CAM_ASM_000754 /LENGTH=67 /DNA_ID=CAMNT_0043206019 /DNA_START=241 /DNA_END=441 /DNA_ORIENTATION=-